MKDFADLLNEMVVLGNGIAVVLNEEGEGDDDAAEVPGKALSLPAMIKMLRKMAIKVKEQADIMDQKMDGMLTALGVSIDDVETQFSGLRHLTDEQQAHITKITTEANTRIKKLKKDLAPLAKLKGLKDMDSVDKLIQRVNTLDAELKQKQLEMDTQKQEYEDLLDYYEDIMIDMKHAEMEAKRQLQNANAAMTGAWEHAVAELEEETKKPLTESAKPKKKKKRPKDYQHYGTFNLNEHLAKAREKLPKAKGDW